ncbi:MAG: NAD-dependent epimerase/dehydratase family protein, partial [Dehalococcoidia bacterium]|nr:NAD-dependent epimerase/dehydratase family protein [Dehalococcoidia bacterium]
MTGATGFVGGNLARELRRRGYDVRALVRPGSNTLTIDGTGVEQVPGDILDRESVDRALGGCEVVFHCAAAYTFWAPDSDLVYRTNVGGTANVLEAARQAGVSRVVYTSTVSTVGLATRRLGTEDTPVDPSHLVGHYKKSKYRAECLALTMALDGLPVVVVNPTTPVGPWDVKPTPTGRMVLDFLRGRIPVYLETGMNLVDVADVAAGHILAMEQGEPGQRYLLGNQNVTLRGVFAMLQEATGRRAPRWRAPYWLALGAGYLDQLVEGKFLGREPRIPLEGLKVARTPMYVSCQKAVTELGQPQSSVEAALERSVKWFIDHGYART